MICDNCVKDLKRAIVARAGVPVNCLAYECFNYVKDADGYLRSACEPFKKSILDTVNKWSRPERLNPEDHVVEADKMVCDSLNSMET